MTVTLAIVALAATLTLPRLVGRGRGSLPRVADDVAERLTAARWHAVVAGRLVSVVLDDLPAGLRMTEETAPQGTGDPRRVAITFAPLPAVLPRTIALTDDATGETVRITIPAGLAAVTIAWEAPV